MAETQGVLAQAGPISRPLLPLAAGFAAGMATAWLLGSAPGSWTLAGLLGLLAGGLAAWRWPRLWQGTAVCLFVCLGGHAMASALSDYPPHHLHRLPEDWLVAPLALEGWVAQPPDPRPAEVRDGEAPGHTRFVAEVIRIRLGGRWISTTGRARLTLWESASPLTYGTEVRGIFRLRHPRRFDNPGSFDYPAYLATQGVFLEGWTRAPVEVIAAAHGSRLLAAVFALRERILRRLDGALPPDQAALLKATVLGDRSGLSPEMNQAFLDSGTYHILAISGLNVSLLAGALFGLFRLLRVSPRAAAGGAALLVTLYAALAGGGASVVRAAVMTDLYLLAVILDRRGDLLNSLGLAALVLLWWNPRFLLDIGFQLTFLATLGIVLVVPTCERILAGMVLPLRWLLGSMAITLASTAMTLPVLAATFNRVSPVGVLANIPIVPLSGVITAVGTGLCALLLVLPAGFPWLLQLTGGLVDLLFGLAAWFGRWPGSTVAVFSPTPAMSACYYGILAAGLIVLTPPRPRLRAWAAGTAGGLGLLLVGLVLMRLLPSDRSEITLTLLDVGQGESIFIELPARGRVLVDAGSLGGEGLDIGRTVVVPFLRHEWISGLDVLIITHPDTDHLSGVPTLLRSIPIGEVWSLGLECPAPTCLWLQELLRERRIPHRIVSAASPVRTWGDAGLEIIHPGATRQPHRGREADSLVLALRLGTRAALLTGDLRREAEAHLLQAPIRAQVLKVPHHGSRTSSSPAFLAAVQPEIALVSAGYRNQFGHPHPEVLERYARLGTQVLRTDRHGAIQVTIRPTGIRAESRRTDQRVPAGAP